MSMRGARGGEAEKGKGNERETAAFSELDQTTDVRDIEESIYKNNLHWSMLISFPVRSRPVDGSGGGQRRTGYLTATEAKQMRGQIKSKEINLEQNIVVSCERARAIF